MKSTVETKWPLPEGRGPRQDEQATVIAGSCGNARQNVKGRASD